MSTLYSILIATSVISGLFLVLMVLMQQTSNSGLLSNGNSHFAPGSLDVFKNKLTAIIAIFFICNILMIWVVNNKMTLKNTKSSVVEQIAEKEDKNIIPTE